MFAAAFAIVLGVALGAHGGPCAGNGREGSCATVDQLTLQSGSLMLQSRSKLAERPNKVAAVAHDTVNSAPLGPAVSSSEAPEALHAANSYPFPIPTVAPPSSQTEGVSTSLHNSSDAVPKGFAALQEGATREMAQKMLQAQKMRKAYASHRLALERAAVAANESYGPTMDEVHGLMTSYIDSEAASQDQCPALLLESKHELNWVHQHLYNLFVDINSTELSLQSAHYDLSVAYQDMHVTQTGGQAQLNHCQAQYASDYKMYMIVKAELLEMHHIANSQSLYNSVYGPSIAHGIPSSTAGYGTSAGSTTSSTSSSGYGPSYSASTTSGFGTSSSTSSGYGSSSGVPHIADNWGSAGSPSYGSTTSGFGSAGSASYGTSSTSGFGSHIADNWGAGSQSYGSTTSGFGPSPSFSTTSGHGSASYGTSSTSGSWSSSSSGQTGFGPTYSTSTTSGFGAHTDSSSSGFSSGLPAHGSSMTPGYGFPSYSPSTTSGSLPYSSSSTSGFGVPVYSTSSTSGLAPPTYSSVSGSSTTSGFGSSSYGSSTTSGFGAPTSGSSSTSGFGPPVYSTSTTSGFGPSPYTSSYPSHPNFGMPSGYGGAHANSLLEVEAASAPEGGSSKGNSAANNGSLDGARQLVNETKILAAQLSTCLGKTPASLFQNEAAYTSGYGGWTASSTGYGTGTTSGSTSTSGIATTSGGQYSSTSGGDGGSDPCATIHQALQAVYVKAYVELTRLVAYYEAALQAGSTCEEVAHDHYGNVAITHQQEIDKLTATISTLDHQLQTYQSQLQELMQAQHHLQTQIQQLTSKCHAMDATVSSLNHVRDAIHLIGVCPGFAHVDFVIPSWTGQWIYETLDTISFTDDLIDQHMNAKCAELGQHMRAAETGELALQSIEGMPSINTATVPLMGTCPNCQGDDDESDGVQHASGHARVCWNPQVVLSTSTRRTDCSGGNKAILCVVDSYMNQHAPAASFAPPTIPPSQVTPPPSASGYTGPGGSGNAAPSGYAAPTAPGYPTYR